MKKANRDQAATSEPESARDRILNAAFDLFNKNGYASTSTLEIATRAQVSKRDLYAIFGDKQAMLTACIAEQADRVRVPADLPAVEDRRALAQALTQLGTTALVEICHPYVVTMFRLAIAEVQRSPEVAATLDRTGRHAVRSMVGQLIKQAHSLGLVGGADAGDMTGQFLALLFGDTMLALLLRVRETPSRAEARRRAEAAVAAFLKLHPKT